MSPLRFLTIISAVFSFIGLGLIIVAAFQLFEVRAFVRAAAVADGQVVDLEFQKFQGRSRSSGGYITVFKFSDASGQVHTGRSSFVSKPATHKVGDEVVVLYRPESPAVARIRAFRTLWRIPAFVGGVGLALLICGVFIAARRRVYT